MKKHLFYLILIFHFFCIANAVAQTGITTKNPHASAVLEMPQTDKGFLITRVPITNLWDKVTVPTPAKGMIIMASSDSNPLLYGDNESVKKGLLYKFNGNNWEEMIELEKPSTGIMFPEIVAYGYNDTPISVSGITNGTFNLSTTKRYKDYVTLGTNGAITATKQGYYVWSIQLIFNAFGNNNTNKLALTEPGLVTYAFRNPNSSASVKALQPFSISGSVYLNVGDTSLPFTWKLNAAGAATEEITKQTVVWQYIGK